MPYILFQKRGEHWLHHLPHRPTAEGSSAAIPPSIWSLYEGKNVGAAVDSIIASIRKVLEAFVRISVRHLLSFLSSRVTVG